MIGTIADGLADELNSIGAVVEVVTGDLDLSQASSMQKLVEAAQSRFGRVDSACIRTEIHGTGDIFEAPPEELQYAIRWKHEVGIACHNRCYRQWLIRVQDRS